MTTFKIITRTETSSDYMGYSINEYRPTPIGEHENIISAFLTPENFKHDDFHLIKRLDKNKKQGYLDHALNVKQINISDFKKFNKTQTIEFLDKEIEKKSNRENVINSRYLLDKLILHLSNSQTDTFYLISKHFFDTTLDPLKYDDNHKLTYEGVIYEPYILIIWFDQNDILNVCEYLAD